MQKKIGIMGGSFDPIHHGHLAAAEEVQQKFKLDKIIFIPSKNTKIENNKKSQSASAKHRYLMTILATSTNKLFDVSDIDIERNTKLTYTYDTLSDIKKLYKNAELFFITGADALNNIEKWYRVNDIFKMATIIGVSRANFVFKSSLSKKIKIINIPALEISSSHIRKKVKGNQPIWYLLPDSVVQYISKYNLYK
jgi:nicotinate-nucleotide adenylyltransferase